VGEEGEALAASVVAWVECDLRRDLALEDPAGSLSLCGEYGEYCKYGK